MANGILYIKAKAIEVPIIWWFVEKRTVNSEFADQRWELREYHDNMQTGRPSGHGAKKSSHRFRTLYEAIDYICTDHEEKAA